jgi:hypothetical protein
LVVDLVSLGFKGTLQVHQVQVDLGVVDHGQQLQQAQEHQVKDSLVVAVPQAPQIVEVVVVVEQVL